MLNVFIASLLNMLALFVLYAIHSTLARIGTICAFSLLFMLSAVLFTAADPITVYNSTAAYVHAYPIKVEIFILTELVLLGIRPCSWCLLVMSTDLI